MATTYRVRCRIDIKRIDDGDATTFKGDTFTIADHDEQYGATEMARRIEVDLATRYNDSDPDALIMSHRIGLTMPQQSAMECRDWSEEPVTRACWRPGFQVLGVPASNVLASQLLDDLIEASNAEDAQAEHDDDTTTRRHARNASLCLSRISDKVANIISSRTAPHPRP